MREKFSMMLTDAALADERVLLLTGDHGYALFDRFRQHCPDRFINCGVAEQNMVGIAAGLAKAGFRPIVYGLSAFVPIRVLEQIKMDVCYEELPVIFIGDGAGVVYGQLGASHQSNEDVAALRAMPHLEIFSPCDRAELAYCFSHMLQSERPAYLRFGKADCGDVHNVENAALTAPIGDLLPVRQGAGGNDQKALLATGSMVSVAAAVSDEIGDIPVWSIPALMPFNRAQLLEIANRFDTLFVLEEHSRHGGLGGLVAEIVAETAAAKVICCGVENRFSGVCGDYKYLMAYHGLDKDSIKERLLRVAA